MNSIVKINSNEGGVFNATNNRVSFDIPEGKYYDLSKAYLNIVMSCDVNAEFNTAEPLGTYIPEITFQGTGANVENYAYDNSALVRTVKLDSELRGNIEEIQRADILSMNLNNYSKSTDMETSQYYEKLIQPYNVSRTKSSLFVEIHKEGTVNSRNLSRQPIRIKLTDLLNFSKTTQVNTNRLGKLRLELELNLDRLAPPTQYLDGANQNGAMQNPNSWQMTNDASIGGGNNEQGRLMNATATISANMQTFFVACDSTAQNAGPGNGVVPRIYNRLQDSVYYVGQKVRIQGTYTQGGGIARNNVNQYRTITRIDYNRGDGAGAVGNATGPGLTTVNRTGVLAITFNRPIDAGVALTGGEIFHTLICRGATATFNPVQADFAELVLEEIDQSNVQPEPDTIQYTTYKTEEIDCGGVNNFHHTFQAEPEAITMYITQPTDNTNRCILSRQNDVDSYRIRINNKDASARPIFLRDTGGANVRSNGNDPLHIIKQQNALANSERDVMDLKERLKNQSVNDGTTPNTYDTDALLIGQVLPMTAQPKQVNIEVNCRAGGGGLNNLCVFREVLAEI